jgi:hypothetical protein
MVGPCGLEPQTSTVSKRRHYVLTITYKALRTALVRANMAKTKDLQVKLQGRKNYGRSHSRPENKAVGAGNGPIAALGFHGVSRAVGPR